VEKAERLASVDVLRGIIMALMALDHTRDYFSNLGSDGMDPTQTTPALFLTRWMTHFCAPAFFLLAGLGAYLYLSRGKTRWDLTRFLLIRGALLIFLDLTVVRFAWDFNLAGSGGPWFIVLTALGASMFVLAGLIYLPHWAIAVFSVLMIVGHNWFDGFDSVAGEILGPLAPLWTLLHVQGGDEIAGIPFYVTYPLIPWLGVMPLGYVLGPILQFQGPTRRKTFLWLGAALTLGFFVVRWINIYGDPSPWSIQPDPVGNMVAFFGPEKYPPSLQYLLMTLGPICLALGILDQAQGPIVRRVMDFGRVPLFFYVAHLFVIHGLAVIAGTLQGHRPLDLCVLYRDLPQEYGFGLPIVYLMWLLVLVLLYPVCAWFSQLKRRSKQFWLAYL
jgi:uncharacterized membrane protein